MTRLICKYVSIIVLCNMMYVYIYIYIYIFIYIYIYHTCRLIIHGTLYIICYILYIIYVASEKSVPFLAACRPSSLEARLTWTREI